jgi:hypothetical protein
MHQHRLSHAAELSYLYGVRIRSRKAGAWYWRLPACSSDIDSRDADADEMHADVFSGRNIFASGALARVAKSFSSAVPRYTVARTSTNVKEALEVMERR